MSIKISVIIPVFNAERHINEALDSVLRQSLQNIEIVCVDDCSTDGSARIIQDISNIDKRVRYFKMETNSGAGACRNYAMEQAKGDYMAFLDPDDLLANDTCLQSLYEAAINNNTDIAGGNLLWFWGGDASQAIDWGKGTFIENGIVKYREYPYAIGFTRFIYKRKFIDKIGARFPDLRRYQDPVWFVEVMMAAKQFYAVNIPFYVYRKNHEGRTLNHEKIKHVLSGMTLNLQRFRESDLQDHYMQEQKELKNFICHALYKSAAYSFGFLKTTLSIISDYKKQSDDIHFQLYDCWRFIKIGLIILRSKLRS